MGRRSIVRGIHAAIAEDLYRWSRDSECNCARGRDFCVSRGARDRAAARPAATASHRRLEILAGVAFWTVLTLVASALPVKLPHGHTTSRRRWLRSSRRWHSVGRLSVVGSRRSERPKFARFVDASRGTGPSPIMRASTLPAIVAGVRLLRTCAAFFEPPGSQNLAVDFLATMLAAAVLLRPQRGHRKWRCSRCGRVNRSLRSSSGDSRDTAFNNIALAPLGWLMAIVYWIAVVGHPAVRVAAVHDADGVAAVRRDARHVHADDRGAGRGRRQARSVHGSAQPERQGDRGRHRAGDAGQRR